MKTQTKFKKKKFKNWIKQRADDCVDVVALSDYFDSTLTLSENKTEFLKKFPHFRTDEEMAKVSLEMFVGCAIDMLKDVDSKIIKKSCNN